LPDRNPTGSLAEEAVLRVREIGLVRGNPSSAAAPPRPPINQLVLRGFSEM
jgi:hypothetical protein